MAKKITGEGRPNHYADDIYDKGTLVKRGEGCGNSPPLTPGAKTRCKATDKGLEYQLTNLS